MREIKFRAWDKKSNRMIYIENPKQHPPYIRFQSPTNKPVLVIGEEWELEPTRLVMDIELMQYTGMKDKNGKEIYEGDIVKECVTTSVVENEMTFNCGCCSTVYGWEMPTEDHHLTVIGNIYENPDLLGGKKKEEEA